MQNLNSQADITKEECDIGTFTNLLSLFLAKPEKTLKERAEFFTSYCKMFEKTLIAFFDMSQDKQYCFNLLQLFKRKKDARNSGLNRDDN